MFFRRSVAAIAAFSVSLTVITFSATVSAPIASAVVPINTLVNTIAMVDPNTGSVISGGLIGDTLNFNLASPAGTSVPVVFSTGISTTATQVGSITSTQYKVTVPIGAITGPVTINRNNAGIFQVWATRGEPYVMPNGHLNVTYNDLQFILDQIKMSEAHAKRTGASLPTLAVNTSTSSIIYPYDVTSVNRCLSAADITEAQLAAYGSTGLSGAYVWTAEDPLGARQVDGQCNNISSVLAEANPAVTSANGDSAAWGAADQLFTRLTNRTSHPNNADTSKYDGTPVSVRDATPRQISNMISDQSTANPAAVAAADDAVNILYGAPGYTSQNSINATNGSATTVLDIPNITADYNVSAGYNSWFTLFGQFFDHGLDLVPKAGPSVLIPLKTDDPLYVAGGPNMMVLTRAIDSSGEALNSTTPWIDQSQTYGSHPSQNFFLREYAISGGSIKSTGKMLDDSSTEIGMPTWKAIKRQALSILGIRLTDYDAKEIPVIATNQYGKFIAGPSGYPLMLFKNGANYKWVEATPSGISTGSDGSTSGGGAGWLAVGSGHAFINDTTASAVPFAGSQCGANNGKPLTPDSDSIMNSATANPSCTSYDDETLNAHLVAGDGRINENIGLSAVHNVFHAEHNLLVGDIKDLLSKNPVIPAAFAAEWNVGDRLYQGARFIMEMEYQHMAYDEFVRRIAPELPVFLNYDPTVNPQITQEFASAVYRLGHSMLNETIARSNPGQFYDPNSNQDVPLITAFTNPAQARLARPAIIASAAVSGSSIVYTMQSGEISPLSGEIVSISNLVVPAFNIQDAVVASNTSTTFTVSSHYQGGSAPIAISLPVTTSTISKVAPFGCTTAPCDNYAAVAVSDPVNNPYAYTPLESAAAIAQGMSSQRGNEIDEFVTDGVRNNLLGLPLDLASLNIARGRDVGMPTLNEFRKANPSKLTPYRNWQDFIINGLRHRASGVNFIAAYGQDPSIKGAATTAAKRSAAQAIVSITLPALITGASNSGSDLTFTADNSYAVGQSVTVTGISIPSTCNGSFTVSAANATTFTVQSSNSCAGYRNPSATSSGSGGSSIAINSALIANATNFMNSTGSWATNETGLNNIDLWIGGLAENPAKQPVTPPMLGPTFQYVFTQQMQALQDSDRFYYLSRLLGLNLLGSIPEQKFTDIVRRNTPSALSGNTSTTRGILGMNSPGFGIADCSASTNSSLVPSSMRCNSISTTLIAGGISNTDLLNAVLFADPSQNSTIISGGGGDDSVQGGNGNDWLSGGPSGGDRISGAGGNDTIFGGPGEDIIDGGSGNDIINAGTSQFGDLADGGSGNDFIHCGLCTGIALTFHGESGNDFVQGGLSSDLGLFGGEGDDWVEGGPGLDIVNGDNGFFGNVALGLPAYYGGNDVLNPGPGLDATSGDGGDDIFILGEGTGFPDGSYGFDWANYEYAKRFDNGPALRANVWADLGGTMNPTTSRTGDALVNIEALSGSAGNDKLFGGVGRNPITIAQGSVVGTKDSNILTIRFTGAAPAILSGDHVSGTGIAPNTIVTNLPPVVSGTSITVQLSKQNTAALTGPVTFFTDPLFASAVIDGLTSLIAGSSGATNNFGAEWAGGAIIMGGDGNDSLYPSTGADVIHGSAYLHTCIAVNSTNSAVLSATDVDCGIGRGFSNMTLVAPFMDSGVLTVSALSIVRELKSTAVSITAVVADATSVTYTAANKFAVGDIVSISKLATTATTNISAYTGISATVTQASATSFKIALASGGIAPTTTSAGSAVAADTLDLSGGLQGGAGNIPTTVGGISGPKTQFTFTAITGTLPLGATYGCTVRDSVSRNTMTVYDVEFVKFTTGALVPITNCGGNTAALAALSTPIAPTVAVITAFAQSVNGAAAVSVPQQAVTLTWLSNSGVDYYAIKMYDSLPVTTTTRTGNRTRTTTSVPTQISIPSGTCIGNVVPDPSGTTSCTVTNLVAGTKVSFKITAYSGLIASADSPYSTLTSIAATTSQTTTLVNWANMTVGLNANGTINLASTALATPGTFTYALDQAVPSTCLTLSGINYQAGSARCTATLIATFTPTDPAFTPTTATMTITVTDLYVPILVWPDINNVAAGSTGTLPTPMVSNPSTVDISTLGTFTYNLVSGSSISLSGTGGSSYNAFNTTNAPATSTVGVTFTPTDPSKTASATINMNMTVLQRIAPVLTWTPVSPVVAGASAVLFIAPTVANNAMGTFVYSLISGTTISLSGSNNSSYVGRSAGSSTIRTTFTPTDSSKYVVSTVDAIIDVTAAPVITPPPSTGGTFTISASPAGPYTTLSRVTLTATGAGSGTLSYTATPSPACKITGNLLSPTSSATCTVVGKVAGTSPKTSNTLILAFDLAEQPALIINNSLLTAKRGVSFYLTTAGGSGSGALTFNLVSGAPSTCQIVGNVLSSAIAADCGVTVTKAQSTLYNAKTSPAVLVKFT